MSAGLLHKTDLNRHIKGAHSDGGKLVIRNDKQEKVEMCHKIISYEKLPNTPLPLLFSRIDVSGSHCRANE